MDVGHRSQALVKQLRVLKSGVSSLTSELREEKKLTKVAQHVALRAKVFRNLGTAFDLVKQGSGGEFEDVCEEIEAASVGHCCMGGGALVSVGEKGLEQDGPRMMCWIPPGLS